MTARAAAEARAREIALDMASLAVKGRTGIRVWSTEKNRLRAEMLTAFFERRLLSFRAAAIQECKKVEEKSHDVCDPTTCCGSIATRLSALGPATEGETT